uniref:Exocyst complex component 5 n=1 Tax=Xenopsylla cheopis TaxID=163159 RepID=A0A6M2DSW5_XENCH
MMMQYLKELEQEPFDTEEFIDRLTWRTLSESGSQKFDPDLLHDAFKQAIKDLKVLQERQQKKCEKLEASVVEEEKSHAQKLVGLLEKHQNSVRMFHELDEKINSVSTKVLHLGEQLESVDAPRSRVAEAQKLMHYLGEFLSPGPVLAPIFVDKSKLSEAADIIQKLHSIAQDLPVEKFDSAKKRIEAKYDEIERNLIEEFVRAQQTEDIEKMKQLAGVLSHFKGYSQCIDAYIEQSQISTYGGKDIFAGILPMCERNNKIIQSVFSSPQQVMGKFVLNIFHLKIQQFTESKLSDKHDPEKYLKNLSELYSRTVKLSNDLSHFDMGSEEDYLSKLTANIFSKYLDSYINNEMSCLRQKSSQILQKFYDSKKHIKKQLQSGGFQDLRRDLQAKLAARTNLNIAQIEDYGGETFLSEELAINILQESKVALNRCLMLSKEADLPTNMVLLSDLLFHYLLTEHCDYALELGLQGVPLGEGKSPPQIYFFDIVRQCNTIIHLMEKLLNDSVLPSIVSTPKYADFLQKKRFLIEGLEMKLDNGLDRSLNAILSWVRNCLQNEQKKSDFRPETDVDTLPTQPCQNVVQYVTSSVKKIRECLDGKNIESLMYELGVRFHRVVYEHLQQFQYNSAGAMIVICDVNEYRKCVRNFECDIVVKLFDTVHALCNLLLVKPENLQEVCEGETLAELECSVLSNFIQLRTDYKSHKLATYLKGLAT